MRAKTFLMMLFVLTPLAAIQTFMGAMFLHFTVGEGVGQGDFFMLVFAVIVMIGMTFFTHKIRYKDPENVILFVLDVLLSVARLPLQLISDILAIIAFFNDNVDVDPYDEPDIESDGLIGFLAIHFLQVNTAARRASWRTYNEDQEASDDPRKYKLQNIRWQLKLWIYTLLHSAPLYFAIWYFFFRSEEMFLFSLIAAPIALVVYVLLCSKTAELKGVRMSNTYYDNRRITEIRYEYNSWNEEWDRSEHVVQEPGYKGFFTIRFVLYLLTGWAWILPQTITLIIALVTPPNAAILPCRAVDIAGTRLSLVDKILHASFGFIINK